MVERLGKCNLFGCQMAGVFALARIIVRKRGAGAPRDVARILDRPPLEPCAACEPVTRGQVCLALSESQPRAGGKDRLQQQMVGIGRNAQAGEHAIGPIKASLLDQDVGQRGDRVLGGYLARRPGVIFGLGEIAAAVRDLGLRGKRDAVGEHRPALARFLERLVEPVLRAAKPLPDDKRPDGEVEDLRV